MKRETSKYRVKTTTFPSTGERFVLVEGPNGIALEATTLYTMMTLRARGLSPSTMYHAIQAVALLLEWADRRNPPFDLDERIGGGTLFLAEEVQALRRDLRADLSKAKAGKASMVATGHYYNRCHAVRDYITWHAENVIRRIPLLQTQRANEHRIRLEDFRTMMVADLPSPRAKSREGVDDAVQQAFLEAIRPGSPTNPFQKRHQARNHALMMLYFVHGLRRAEALKIKGEDLHLSGPNPMIRILVRIDEPEDKRRIEPRAKTEGRDLFVGPELSAILQEWVTKHRPSYPGSKKTPYVFIARDGKPLALSTVNDMFVLLRERVPELPNDFTTHQLRHTANDRLSDLADSMEWNEAEDRRNRNYQFGWSKNSNQGDSYRTKSTRRKAAEASRIMQDKSWNGKAI